MLAVAVLLGDRLILPRETDVELFKRQGAAALWPCDLGFAAEDQKGGREIAAERREAYAATLRCDVANCTGGLEAVIDGAAPPFALVIEDAARIEAQIAADRAHVAVGWAGNRSCGLCDRGEFARHARMACELRQGHGRADFEALLVDRDLAHLVDAVHVDQDRGPNDAPAHVHDKIGAAPKEPAIRKIGSRLDDILDRTGSDDR